LLAKVEQVRGLITFLFAFSTTSVIILIAIAIFFLKDSDEVKERYVHAKDLLTVVIGVLGTILGFYFGSAATDTSAVAIANLAASASTAKPNEIVEISGRIIGGSAPYRYTIAFSDPLGKVKPGDLKARQDSSESGGFSVPITIPKVEPTTLLFSITARDSKGVQTQAAGLLPIEAQQ
jgi:hypothetical protein